MLVGPACPEAAAPRWQLVRRQRATRGAGVPAVERAARCLHALTCDDWRRGRDSLRIVPELAATTDARGEEVEEGFMTGLLRDSGDGLHICVAQGAVVDNMPRQVLAVRARCAVVEGLQATDNGIAGCIYWLKGRRACGKSVSLGPPLPLPFIGLHSTRVM
jgi:hypothetical protein